MEELTVKVVSSLKDCLGQKEDKPLCLEEPGLTGVQPPRSKTPKRRRRYTSTEGDLTKAREAHGRALATAATLEDKIEAQPVCHLEWARCPASTLGAMTAKGEDPRDEAGDTTGFGWKIALPPFFEYSPPWWGPEPGEDGGAKLLLLDFDLDPPPELGPEVNHFFQEPVGSSEEDDGTRSSPEAPVEEFERWVTWQAWVHDTTGLVA